MTNFILRCFSFVAGVTENTINSGTNKSPDNGAVSPIYDFLDTFGPLLIGMLLGVGTIYCIILGVQYAKAEKGDERDVAKKKAINAIVSFLAIIILVVILYAFRAPITELLNSNQR